MRPTPETVAWIFETDAPSRFLADKTNLSIQTIRNIKHERPKYVKEITEDLTLNSKKLPSRYTHLINPKNRSDTMIDTFLSYLSPEDENGCIRWNGTLNNKKVKSPLFSGLNVGEVPENFYNKGRPRSPNSKATMCSAHRWWWEVNRGYLPPDMNLNHSRHCEEHGLGKLCMNLDHMSVGTQQENMTQAIELGLIDYNRKRGEKLSDEQAEEVYLSTESKRTLAKKYGVSRSIIHRIKEDKSYLSITSGLEKPRYKGMKVIYNFTSEQAREIYDSKKPYSEIENIYGISASVVRNIKHRKHRLSAHMQHEAGRTEGKKIARKNLSEEEKATIIAYTGPIKKLAAKLNTTPSTIYCVRRKHKHRVNTPDIKI